MFPLEIRFYDFFISTRSYLPATNTSRVAIGKDGRTWDNKQGRERSEGPGSLAQEVRWSGVGEGGGMGHVGTFTCHPRVADDVSWGWGIGPTMMNLWAFLLFTCPNPLSRPRQAFDQKPASQILRNPTRLLKRLEAPTEHRGATKMSREGMASACIAAILC